MAQILAFGDSITDGAYDVEGGWANRLQRFFMAENMKGDVVNDESNWFYNLGISADTVEKVLKRIEVESKSRKIDVPSKQTIVLFAIGVNDSASTDDPSNYQFSIDEFEANLHKLVGFTQKYTNKIIFVGLMPVIENLTQPIYGQTWYSNERIKLFNNSIQKIAAGYNLTFIDLFAKFQAQPEIEQYFIDGLHPNTVGHKWMFEQIKPELLKVLAK